MDLIEGMKCRWSEEELNIYESLDILLLNYDLP